jgi:hypothetical protein
MDAEKNFFKNGNCIKIFFLFTSLPASGGTPFDKREFFRLSQLKKIYYEI